MVYSQVTLSGTADQRAKARQLIEELVGDGDRDRSEHRRGGGGGGGGEQHTIEVHDDFVGKIIGRQGAKIKVGLGCAIILLRALAHGR